MGGPADRACLLLIGGREKTKHLTSHIREKQQKTKKGSPGVSPSPPPSSCSSDSVKRSFGLREEQKRAENGKEHFHLLFLKFLGVRALGSGRG